MAGLYDFADQSFPFAYIHLTFVVCSIYLLLITYTIATYLPASTASIFPHLLGAISLLINVVFVIGLRKIGKQMMDPYGQDVQSLSVMHYIEFTFTASRKILAGHRFASPGITVEEHLESCRPNRGEPFMKDPMYYALNHVDSDDNEELFVLENNGVPIGTTKTRKKKDLQEMKEDDDVIKATQTLSMHSTLDDSIKTSVMLMSNNNRSLAVGGACNYDYVIAPGTGISMGWGNDNRV